MNNHIDFPFIADLHMHTNCSDGEYPPDTVIRTAVKREIRVMAITDHNYLHNDFDDLKGRYGEKIILINGAEFSTGFKASDCLHSKEYNGIELHVVGLGIQSDTGIQDICKTFESGHEKYFNAIRKAFKERCKLILPEYEELNRRYPIRRGNGLMLAADELMETGMMKDFEEIWDVYLGRFGERRAYVDPLTCYGLPTLEQIIGAIVQAGGIPVLAHPLSYGLSSSQVEELAGYFSKIAHGATTPAGIEVWYESYAPAQQLELKVLADKYDLLYSGGSDFHGRHPVNDKMAKTKITPDIIDKHILSKLIV